MAWAYEIDHQRRVVLARVSGAFNDQDLLDGDSKLRSDPDFRPYYDQLVDLREASGADISAAGVRELVSRPPLFAEDSR
jgi:hypothetical protein